MEVSINYWAVIAAMLSSMAVGSIWYAKRVFGDTWANLVGLDDKKMGEGSTRAIAVTAIVSLITAYVLAYIAYISNQFFQNSFLMDTLTAAFWLWAGFTATRFITHDAFEQRPTKLTALNISHEFVTLMIMGLIIGLLGVS